MKLLWCNGRWLEPGGFPVSPADRGLLHGLGLFETVLVIEGRPVFADRHLDRLRAGCRRLGWTCGFPDLLETMGELVRRNDLTAGRARIRLSITAGGGGLSELALGADHLVWMTAAPVADAPPTLCVNLCPWTRNERSALAGLKCASYAENLVALGHAARLGFQETLFLNTAGHLCEAATANVFLIDKGVLHTPPLESGCLPGITRARIIELAAQLGIPCEQRNIPPRELLTASELFLTSSIRGVTAVTRFERNPLPSGPLTRLLDDAWNAAVSGNKQPSRHV